MKRSLPTGLALLIACGAPLSTTTTAVTASPDAEVFECANEFTKTAGFQILSIDRADMRLVVRKPNESIRRSDPSFFRAHDELTIEVGAESADGRSLRVIARTLLEFSRRKGSEFEPQKPSRTAERAAESLVRQCAGEGAADQVP